MTSPYQTARSQGYSDDEIMTHLENHPKYSDKIKKARSQGYSDLEISDFLSSNKPQKETKKERSGLEKTGRIASQYALGAAENAMLPYEIASVAIDSKESQGAAYRTQLFENIEDMQQLKELSPNEWGDSDQKILDSLVEQVKDPKKSEEFIQTADIGIRGIAEKITGEDLHPEGFLEKAAGWTGFIKKNAKKILKLGMNPKELTKAIFPTGTELLRGSGAGAALEMAEQGNFGPIGTMAAVVAGDLLGGGTANILHGTKELITKPKQTLAKIGASFTPKEKVNLQKEIIQDFRDAGIQADIGSITDSNLLKWTQSRLAQSGLTGKALDELKQEITSSIKEEYNSLAKSLGEAKYSTLHEAGEVTKEGIKSIRDADLAATRQLYTNATNALREDSRVSSRKLASAIEKLEKQLLPGKIKSTEQQAVLNTIEKLKQDVYDPKGNLKLASVKDLMNNKIALNDIINYEVQGGSKQLLKGIVGELDRAIISHGKENPSFARNYINANKKFSQHAKTYRNKNVDQLLRAQDPAQVMNKMNSVQGIRDIKKILTETPEGENIFKNLKRLKFDKTIGDNLIDSTSQQAKLGTFSKLLEKGKNREVIKEILGTEGFKILERLQKNAGRLADASNKFLNASKSGAVAADAAVLAKGLSDIANILSGNPWPLAKTIGGILAARKLSNLLGDREFLKLVEDVILASEKGSKKGLIESVELLKPYIIPAMQQAESTIQDPES